MAVFDSQLSEFLKVQLVHVSQYKWSQLTPDPVAVEDKRIPFPWVLGMGHM